MYLLQNFSSISSRCFFFNKRTEATKNLPTDTTFIIPLLKFPSLLPCGSFITLINVTKINKIHKKGHNFDKKQLSFYIKWQILNVSECYWQIISLKYYYRGFYLRLRELLGIFYSINLRNQWFRMIRVS